MAATLTGEPQSDPFEWASSTFLALGGSHYDEYPKGSLPDMNHVPTTSAFASIHSSLLADSSVERYGQITPPNDLSPTDLNIRKDSGYRESSIPLEQLENETSWPSDQTTTQSRAASEKPEAERATKRRRTSKGTVPIESAPTTTKPAATEEKPRRRRGRPKAQPVADSDEQNRQSHLEKNRQAAFKCRQKKKHYIQTLEERAREGSAANKALKEHVALLKEEVLQLKNEVLRHAGCGFWGVDEYLARCAGGLLRGPDPTAQRSTLDTSEMSRFDEMLRKRAENDQLAQSGGAKLEEGGMDIDELLEEMDEEIESQNSFNLSQ